MDSDLLQAVKAKMVARTQRKRMESFKQWCASLDHLPPGTAPTLKRGLIADIELQPHRWLTAGLNLLRTQHIAGSVQATDGFMALPFRSFLPYPVFQMGAEVFLKGMWLCQFPACRRVAHNSYAGKPARVRYGKSLKILGHDLLKIVGALREVRKYRDDPSSLCFLNRVEAIIRRYYSPLYAADQRGSEWATSRYPKRFYRDGAGIGRADAMQSFPQQWMVVALFEAMDQYLDGLWQLRAHLLQQRRKKAPKTPATSRIGRVE
jgi:hypothetical protein